MINKFIFVFLMFGIWGDSNGQNINLYSDTSFYTHSKYVEYENGVLVKNYFLSDVDYNLIISEDTRLRLKDNILNKYRSFDHDLFSIGSEFVSPYDLFGLLTNETEYDFVFPFTSYVLNWEIFRHFYLNDRFGISKRWGMADPDIYFYDGNKLVKKICVSFPVTKERIREFAEKSTHFIIEISNKYNDRLTAEFMIKNN